MGNTSRERTHYGHVSNTFVHSCSVHPSLDPVLAHFIPFPANPPAETDELNPTLRLTFFGPGPFDLALSHGMRTWLRFGDAGIRSFRQNCQDDPSQRGFLADSIRVAQCARGELPLL